MRHVAENQPAEDDRPEEQRILEGHDHRRVGELQRAVDADMGDEGDHAEKSQEQIEVAGRRYPAERRVTRPSRPVPTICQNTRVMSGVSRRVRGRRSA